MPENVPDSISIYDFMFDERYGRYPAASSRAPFVCGLTGKKYSTAQVKDRVEILARGLAQELEWQPNKGTEWEKAACVFTLNAVWPSY
jgi:ribosome assembly protein SQT1